MAKPKTIRITLNRSPNGRKPKRGATLKARGLRRSNQTVEVGATPQSLGMTVKVSDLITIEEAS